MKVFKYSEYIKEELQDTPESYIETALAQLKKKLDKLFDDDIDKDTNKVLSPKELEKVDSKKMSFKDLGIRLESSELSKYSKLYDSLTIKFSDDNNTYALIIMIDIKEAIPEDKEKDFDIDDIEKAYIKFKKYDLDTFEILGQLSKNVKLKDINEEFLIDLKIELDDKFSDEDEEFEVVGDDVKLVHAVKKLLKLYPNENELTAEVVVVVV